MVVEVNRWSERKKLEKGFWFFGFVVGVVGGVRCFDS